MPCCGGLCAGRKERNIQMMHGATAAPLCRQNRTTHNATTCSPPFSERERERRQRMISSVFSACETQQIKAGQYWKCGGTTNHWKQPIGQQLFLRQTVVRNGREAFIWLLFKVHLKQSLAPQPFYHTIKHLSECLRWRENMGEAGGVTVCDSHREDQLLNPCTISTESLLSDVEALQICILVM